MEGKWESVVQKLSELAGLKDPQESMGHFLWEKSHRLLQVYLSTWALLVDKFDQTLTRERRSLAYDFVAEKLDQLFRNVWALLAESFSRVPPPEKRTRVQVGLATIAVVLLSAYFCRGKKPGHGTGRMMKAPGARGAVIARKSFEGNPKGYFRNHRAHQK
ncbi:uncharacterized protein A4U43_C08F20540 [Asparagus officinalis]|nr:uncharacterized protein A4U43_C08F20540 [Asparagus officinalis]